MACAYFGLNFQFLEDFEDMEKLEVDEGITSVLVALRYGMMTIFVVTLAKWFSRQQLALVFVSLILYYSDKGDMVH